MFLWLKDIICHFFECNVEFLCRVASNHFVQHYALCGCNTCCFQCDALRRHETMICSIICWIMCVGCTCMVKVDVNLGTSEVKSSGNHSFLMQETTVFSCKRVIWALSHGHKGNFISTLCDVRCEGWSHGEQGPDIGSGFDLVVRDCSHVLPCQWVLDII